MGAGGEVKVQRCGSMSSYTLQVHVNTVISLAGMGHITMETIAVIRQMSPKRILY